MTLWALYPSGFTQLSNRDVVLHGLRSGFVPLWIYTALKLYGAPVYEDAALYPSGFTQLSNALTVMSITCCGFVPLWIYTALKQLRERGDHNARFVPLWIYTALKRVLHPHRTRKGFVPLWIYTALKLPVLQLPRLRALYPSGFTQLSNLKSENPAQPAGVHPEGSPVHFYYSTSGGKGNPSGPYGGPCGGAGGACAAASCARSSHRSSSSSTRRSPGSRG